MGDGSGVVGGLSLVFAILLFWRDRRRDDRELIDKLAVWPTVSYDDKLELHRPDELVAPAQVKLQSKNASDLPIEIHAVECEVTSRWMVPVPGPQVVEAYNVVPSTKAPQVLFSYYDLLPPDHVEVLMDYALTMVDQAPDNAVSLDPIHGVVARVRWFLAIDNAGRRWEVQPGRGRRARRIRWYTPRRAYYPVEWQHPLTRALKLMYYRIRAAVMQPRQADPKA